MPTPSTGEEMLLLMLFVLLCCLSRSTAIWGPKEVRGNIGESLAITCHYDAGYETLRKQWYQGLPWTFCKMLIETNGTEKMLKKDRVTIRDNQSQRKFTVTMERLTFDDAGTYFCGIERSKPHLIHVKLTRGPALITRTTTTTTTMTTTTITTTPTAPAPPEETTYFPRVTSYSSSTMSHPIPKLLSIIAAKLLLFLLVATLLVWKKLKHQSAGHPGGGVGLLCTSDSAPYTPNSTYANKDLAMASSASRSPEVAAMYSNIRRPKAGL